MLLGSEGNCDTCKSLLKGLLNKIRQHFQKFLLSSLTLRRVIFSVNGQLGAPFANFVQKRASYSTFTYIPKSLFPCGLKMVSEETRIAACKTEIWLNKFLTWRFIWLPKLMKLSKTKNLATVNRDSKASSARPEIAAIHKSCSPSWRANTQNVGFSYFLNRCRLQQNSLKNSLTAAEVAQGHHYTLRAGFGESSEDLRGPYLFAHIYQQFLFFTCQN